MNDEVDAVTSADADLEKSTGLVGTDEHEEVVESQYADRVLVCVENVVVGNAVLPGARNDDGIHDINLS